jgi:hypothetical protein
MDPGQHEHERGGRETKMSARSQTGGWRTSAVIAAVMAIAVATYVIDHDAWVFGIGAFMAFAYLLGQYLRRKPNIAVNRIAYVLLFSCWVGLAIFFGPSALFVKTGIVQPSLTAVVAFGGGGFVIGGVIGDWVGGRRGYRPPERTFQQGNTSTSHHKHIVRKRSSESWEPQGAHIFENPVYQPVIDLMPFLCKVHVVFYVQSYEPLAIHPLQVPDKGIVG